MKKTKRASNVELIELDGLGYGFEWVLVWWRDQTGYIWRLRCSYVVLSDGQTTA
jgi:hypothetical protein